MTPGDVAAVLLAAIAFASLALQAFVLLRTGKLITTTDSTHALVNGQSAALVAAVTAAAQAQGYIAGQAAATAAGQPAPAIAAPADPGSSS